MAGANVVWANKGARLYVYVSAAFEDAFGWHGYSCDICGEVTEISEDKLQYAADRALSNLDGLTKLMFCYGCSRKFAVFSMRHFNIEVRSRYSPELERIMLAYIAAELLRATTRVQNGKPPFAADHRRNRGHVTPIDDGSPNQGSIGLPLDNNSQIPIGSFQTRGITL